MYANNNAHKNYEFLIFFKKKRICLQVQMKFENMQRRRDVLKTIYGALCFVLSVTVNS